MEEDGGSMVVGIDLTDVAEYLTGQLSDAAPGAYARLTVSDTGTGISENDMSRLFDPYFTTKGTQKGTGLGPRGSARHRESAQGTDHRQQRGGRRDDYTRLPSRGPGRGYISNPRHTAGSSPTGTERILFVDDEPAIVRLQKNALSRLGYTVTAMESSQIALEAFEAAPDDFDLVVTDMTMPGMTGDRLAGKIKQIRPAIPIILCSGYNEKLPQDMRPDLSFDRCLMKPITLSTWLPPFARCWIRQRSEPAGGCSHYQAVARIKPNQRDAIGL